MNKIKLILLLALPVVLIALLVIRISFNEPPLKEMEESRKILASAKQQGSMIYGGRDYEQAVQYYDSAMIAWKRENNRFILFRDFDAVREYATRSRQHAEAYISNVRQDSSQLKMDLERQRGEIDRDLEAFHTRYRDFPYDTVSNYMLVRARLQFMEGSQAFANGKWSEAGFMFDTAAAVIQSLHRDYEQRLNAYLRDLPEWNEWVEQTVSFSRKNRSSCIVIDKMARECMLYRNGKIEAVFTVELGPNWMGDKTRQGDRSTPEGSYRVTGRKAGPETRFYRALLLDYPNAEDKKRFEQNRRNGIIGADALIGGLIEIHGSGGKGVDWTDGCIALKDSDMDLLFDACPVGTRVAIVGSTRSPEQIHSAADEKE